MPESESSPDVTVRSLRKRRRVDTATSRMVGTSFAAWRANFTTFATLTLIVFSPYFAWLVWAHASSSEVLDGAWWAYVDAILVWLLSCVVTAPVVHVVLAHLSHRKPRLGEALCHGLSCLPSVLTVTLLSGLCIACSFLPAAAMALIVGPWVALVGALISAATRGSGTLRGRSGHGHRAAWSDCRRPA